VEEIIRIGLDTSKSVFQLHGVNEAEEPVLRKKLRRSQVLAFFAALLPTRRLTPGTELPAPQAVFPRHVEAEENPAA